MTDDMLLDPDEEVLWSGTPRLSAAAEAIAAGAVLAAVGIAGLAGLPGDVSPAGRTVFVLPLLLGVLVAAYRVVAVRRTRYAVSDRALYARSGVLSRRVRRMGLDRVQNSAYGQPITGRVFGYGTVTVESAGAGQAVRFRRIETPREVRALVDRRAALAGDAVPGSAEQWEAVLAEVRDLRRVVETRRGVR